MEEYELLEWDSHQFGFLVAKIDGNIESLETISRILEKLKHENVRLVYFPSKSQLDIDAISKVNGILVDKKTHFLLNLNNYKIPKLDEYKLVEKHLNTRLGEDLIELAIQSGEFSRFSVDPNFPRDKFLNLYRVWIERSITHEIAHEVFTIQDDDKAVGLITVGSVNGRGDIGLLAVNEHYRGRQYGKLLVFTAIQWFQDNNFKLAQVITQGENSRACNFYTKCGFKVEKTEYYYHFWI